MAKKAKDKKIKKLKAKVKKLKSRAKKATAAAADQVAATTAMSTPQVSPLAVDMPDLPVVDGVRFATASAGIRYKGRTDLMLAVCDPGTTMAGVTTRSATRSASVLDVEAKLKGAKGKAGWAILVNSGNANAFTGQAGVDSVAAITQAVAQATGLPATRVLTSSTGVIGEPLPPEKIAEALPGLGEALSPGGMEDAARAIMTTDTFPKAATRTVEIEGETVTVAGFAKGSGMIAPDMATMLAYVFTDARAGAGMLASTLRDLADKTFNAITVDGDTSTSDTVLLAATQKAGPAIASARTRAGRDLKAALHEVLQDLALQIVRDGEGATKLVEIRVEGAANAQDARRVASAIANSPLVKTAIAGEDPNWGRIVMAVGKSGARADRDRLSIRFGEIEVARDGRRADDYDEETAASYMTRAEIAITVDLGLGEASDVMWTCDLTHRYIDINADYRS
ncbi:bifunctional glutamate N-acetyltransferase/amino-acid acetyltransferase ArgJ [Jannaschia aquimarina]|uniref:Arginine biosynthesis bifunctional protein ArgJ n=1 Tax=Jannaschia aquimarina TaxID=935700 RepID=A0A0D1EAU2_9RHOB|nr:bifunctional glutamate N-acetyltransferase/amino-acid acetyltransferase ArgJ [Jannaschia aquimarina]KIT14824.1 Arginine biosynthesis bifunctional protein ArgJ [Jannaschia aquimarina]SNS56962.1 glutamate N-acetyltransferase [Jannaschia aquimarina]